MVLEITIVTLMMLVVISLRYIGCILERIANALEYQNENLEWVLSDEEEER